MSSFDPKAAAIDWFGAYRAANLNKIVELYADDAALECCDEILIAGRAAISAYWGQRLAEKPAGELDDLSVDGEAIVLSYCVADGVGQMSITFNEAGKIRRSQCREA